MSQTYNLSDLIQFLNEEDELLEDFINEFDFEETKRPSSLSVQNVLNYSKALSITKSEYLKNIEVILN